MYTIKVLLDQPFRFALTVGGVALCVILMLFLLSVYQGVAVGSIEYVRASKAEYWIMQQQTTNILRSTSLLTAEHGRLLETIRGVKSISPVLFILSCIRTPDGPATTYLTGYDPECGYGGPPEIIQGHSVQTCDQIVLDRSFAAKYRISVGDRVPVKDDSLTVVGLSGGTNMFVIQYAFVTLERARMIAGLPGIVSCYQMDLDAGTNSQSLINRIQATVPDIALYNRDTFLENNIREMESGFLPLLFVVAVIGSVVLSAILSLILSVNVLEQRKDYAVMKALGSPRKTLSRLVSGQAFMITGLGTVTAIILYYPLTRCIERLMPEVSTRSTPAQIIAVVCGALIIGWVSSIFPNRRLRHIYPLEVFR